AFCSSWGDDALDLLGDLAFQDGRFDEALSMYRQLVPDHEADRAALVYPDPGVDVARVAAKKLLCRAALGESPPGPADLEAYAKAYPNASGALAGRNGPYARTMAEALKGDHLAPPTQPDERWPTFAGSFTRSKVVAGSIDVGSLQWKVELPAVETGGNAPRMGGRMGFTSPQPTPDRLLAYHPIVLGDQVLVADENRILAYNLNDRPGNRSQSIEPAWKRDESKNGFAQARKPSAGVPRYTLTAYGDRVFARMGPTNWMSLVGMRPVQEARSYLIAVDRGTEGKLLWTRQATDVTLPKRQADAPARSTGFEGTPVADGRNVYVAMTDRREQTATYVACLDAETGNTRWVRYLGAASSDGDNMMMGFGMNPTVAPTDFGHRLLSLDGPTIYYQTNLGAVVALDAETGGIRWVATYPRQDRNGAGEGHDRDLNPAIVHDGLVIVAPEDATAIFAFDAATGRMVWKSPTVPEEARLAHLLGVAKGRLVATGDKVLLYDVKNGKLLHSWPDGGGRAFSGYGRGVLAGDKIYWPTRTEIHVLDQTNGQRTEPSIQLAETFHETGGNLAVGDGYLIVAQSDALVVFCQNSRLIERYRQEIARNPEQPANYYRLAQAAEAIGRENVALEALEQALARARPSESIDGAPLAESALRQQFRLLMKLGAKAKEAHDLAGAGVRYEAAAGAARSDRDRLAARLALANVQIEQGRSRDAVATLQGLLADERLAAVTVNVDEGHRSVRASLWIADRLATVLHDQGRSVYEEFDRKAAALLERGRAEQDPRLLEEVGRSYPVARVLPDALLALGQMQESRKHPGDAAQAYKRVYAAAGEPSYRAQALMGLARAYETQHLWVPARDAYEQARARYGDEVIREAGVAMKVRQVVYDRLARAPFDRMAEERSEPTLPTPLTRLWGRKLEGPTHPLIADGTPPASDSGRVFLAQGSILRPVDALNGAAAWSADLGAAPQWVGYLTDKVLAATDSRIVALSLAKGEVEWQYDVSALARGRRGANPFARSGGEGDGGETTAGRFRNFQIVGERVVFLIGERKLVALDGDTGLVDWSHSPPSGTINPNLWVGPRHVVFQVRKPESIQVLETSTGRRRAEFSEHDAEEWPRPPLPIDDEHVALVLDRRTVGLFDLRKGTNSWVFRESDKLPTHGPPLLLGNAERLLVLHDGNELVRLDAATGRKRWLIGLGIDDLSERPDALAFDDHRIFWASDRTLQCASLADGAIIWRQPLIGPEAGWSLALSQRCVLAYPRESSQVERDVEGFPLVVRRRETGEYVQRLLFPASVSEVSVRLAPRGALVAARGGVWALGERVSAATEARVPERERAP
ncbi:MAG: PQQ-binding-like beta-propeller repeat protein, partial [Isosphaeraceae bacterium]|nr:PQQ-binding-like beta-propeller repeat protein [Isosphaeraceae bacterium]